jgi:hypothetical protein
MVQSLDGRASSMEAGGTVRLAHVKQSISATFRLRPLKDKSVSLSIPKIGLSLRRGFSCSGHCDEQSVTRPSRHKLAMPGPQVRGLSTPEMVKRGCGRASLPPSPRAGPEITMRKEGLDHFWTGDGRLGRGGCHSGTRRRRRRRMRPGGLRSAGAQFQRDNLRSAHRRTVAKRRGSTARWRVSYARRGASTGIRPLDHCLIQGGVLPYVSIHVTVNG